MGLNLSGTKGKKPIPKSAGKKKVSTGKQVKQDSRKATRAVKTQRRQQVDDLEQDDEVVIPTVQGRPAPPQEVRPVGPFESGLVHQSIQNGVNAYRRRSDESDIFGHMIQSGLLIDGVFFGAIYVKSSFAKRAGGSALL